jgi:DNA-binding response OmpR family regulator
VSGRILVVDDSALNQMVLQRFLHRHGYESDLVSTGADAVEAIDAGSYVLAFLDLRLPLQDGFKVARTIREKGHRIPIIALAVGTDNEDQRKGQESGIDGYLTMPVNMGDMSNVLERFLRRAIDPNKDLANILLQEAKQAREVGNIDRAISLYEEAIAGLENSLGKDDARLLTALRPLLTTLQLYGRAAQAEGVRERMRRLLESLDFPPASCA